MTGLRWGRPDERRQPAAFPTSEAIEW